MSASPAGPPGSTPNGGAPVYRRKPKANPLITRPKPGQRGPPTARPRPKTGTPPAPPANGPTTSQPRVKDEPDVKFRDIPVFTTKRAILKGLRHHLMRLQGNQTVDPTNQDEWTRPVRLHRRDLQAIMPGGETMDVDTKEIAEADQERERIEAVKAERKRIRDENLAQIAPSTKTQKQQNTRRKATAVSAYELNETPEQQKRSQLRYEESIPWHLEDFDNQHTWRGAYEGGLVDQFIVMVREPGPTQQGQYRVMPVEKFYKFREVGKMKTMTYDEAEAEMKKKYKGPRFVQEAEDQMAASKQRSKDSERGRGFVVSRPDTQRVTEEAGAGNDHDFDFDMKADFDDDDEGDLFGEDEETRKEAEEAIFKEQRQANVFGLTDEQEVEREEQNRQRAEERQRELEKKLKKSLWKKERNNAYLEDEDGNPYFASSDSDDSEEEERKRAEEEAAKKAAGEDDKGKDTDRLSGANTGSNTPSGRASKHGEPLTAAASLKRPGSPNLSDASDSESVRKRLKQSHMPAQPPVTRIPSRPHSPKPTSLAASRQGSFSGAAASGSDSETTDGGRRKVSKMQRPSRTGTPIGSRAASPAPGAARAASPEKRPIPTVEDIRNAIPAEGIALKGLLEVFRGRISSDQTGEFIKRVKSVTSFNSQTKTLFAKRT
ncbi:Rap30/74 interaction domain-containing protein [Eremomyces bilateralis CBS 781.70]|uniref:Rap30/74 interaction domain-containing protein n=1 Tax=Eremomyces bilateralis CBS 781.70 TaxID=1392243 RepID=A0A6G1G4R9_9PEZI|nr:Rap30/74 interaction domain-containing protein [Eremomyces bilateralis CBS 781.70]KAF1812829.1 Rap30/74 interaction domain-containing protein [Eremomyces bilateralis CBS 781.70]